MKTGAKRIAAWCVAGVLVLAAFWMAAASRATDAQSRSIVVDGRTRTYLLHAPSGHNASKKMPLVLVLHGATQSPESAERMSGMSKLADRDDFLVAYPSGTGRLSRVPTWNAGNCCGYALENKVDDVAFISALIDKLEREYPVDPKRVYVTGISNGAMMSYRLACELSDRIAAIAPVEGAQNLDCRPSNRVSVIVFHGTADRLVPYDGGSTPFQLAGRRNDTPVDDTVAFWVKEDACAAAPRREESSEVHTTIYSGCKDGTGVALYAIQGGHHMWPGLVISGNDVPATDLMWAFFMEHPKR
jgi:polyhydroxybutyrate depolymerase